MTPSLSELEALAKAAQTESLKASVNYAPSHYAMFIQSVTPDVLLALIARVRALEEAVRKLRSAFSDSPDKHNCASCLKILATALTDECICRGNWRQIVQECEPLLNRKYRTADGKEWRFFGVVHGADDYYYGMCRSGEMQLLTCVGSIESQGFTLLPLDTALTGAA